MSHTLVFSALQERIDAVEEILQDNTPKLITLRNVLGRLPDLARGLCRIQYGKVLCFCYQKFPVSLKSLIQCTPQELGVVLTAFNRVATAFSPSQPSSSTVFKSPILNGIITALPSLREPIKDVLESISLEMAAEGKKEDMWTDPSKYPMLDELRTVHTFVYL